MAGDLSARIPGNRYWLPWWLLFTVTALLYAVWTPPFMYPDEPTHLAGAMETGNPAAREALEGRILQEMTRQRFWRLAGVETPDAVPKTFYQSPLLRLIPTQFAKPLAYYRVSGAALRIAGARDDIPGALFALRLLGVLLASAAVFLGGLLIREMLPDSPWQAAAMAVMAVPQYGYMAGAVNPGTTAWVTGGLMMLGSIRLLQPEKRYRGWALAGAGVILAVVTHRAALALLPAVILAAIRGRRRLRTHRIPGWAGWLAGIGSAAVCAGMLLRSPVRVRNLAIRFAELFHGMRIDLHRPAAGMDWQQRFWSLLGRSSVMSFGWLSLDGPGWIYFVYTIVPAVAALAWMAIVLRMIRKQVADDRTRVWVLWAGALGMFWAAAGQYVVQGVFAQGRYLFAAWPVFGVLAALGWRAVCPEKFERPVIICIVTAAWLLNMIVLYRYLIQGFYF